MNTMDFLNVFELRIDKLYNHTSLVNEGIYVINLSQVIFESGKREIFHSFQGGFSKSI